MLRRSKHKHWKAPCSAHCSPVNDARRDLGVLQHRRLRSLVSAESSIATTDMVRHFGPGEVRLRSSRWHRDYGYCAVEDAVVTWLGPHAVMRRYCIRGDSASATNAW